MDAGAIFLLPLAGSDHSAFSRHNVLNDLEPVNFIQSEKLRCMSRHQNSSMVSLRDGHFNLAIDGHYNFAATIFVYPKLKCHPGFQF